MGKLVYSLSTSIDGYIEGPDRDISWHRVDEDLHWFFNEKFDGFGAFVSGGMTYRMMADFWPTADQDPESSPSMVEFARIWRDKPKIVYSRTLDHADWNTTIVRDIVPDDVRSLKEQFEGDLVVGGPQIAAQLIPHDLIDEFHVNVMPVAIGAGTPMFPAGADALDLTLIDSRAFGNGVVLLRYARDAD
jgi:dihydrofolate reductase